MSNLKKIVVDEENHNTTMAGLIIDYLNEDDRRIVGMEIYSEGHNPIYHITIDMSENITYILNSMDPMFKSYKAYTYSQFAEILDTICVHGLDSARVVGMHNSADFAKFMSQSYTLNSIFTTPEDIKYSSDALALIALAGTKLDLGPVTVDGHIIRLSEHHSDASTYKISIDGDVTYTSDAVKVIEIEREQK